MSDWPAPDPGIAEAARLQRLTLKGYRAEPGQFMCGREIQWRWHVNRGDELIWCWIDWEMALKHLLDLASKQGQEARDEC